MLFRSHVDGKINPLSDIEVINLELVLADTQVVEKRLGSVEKDVKRLDKIAIKEKEALTKVKEALEVGKLANQVDLNDEEKLLVKGLCLITMKPIMYILNKKAGGTNLDELKDERWEKLLKFFEENNAKWTVVDAGIEHELQEMEGEEKEMFRHELGAKDDGINNLIRKGYELLDLITYFTTGVQETRAWTIGKGWTAPMAGTAIHNDFKDKFIRAEVVFWSDLIEAGSFGTAREKGILRTEGKEYIVKDGDVIEFRV